MMLLLSNCYSTVLCDWFPQELGPTQALPVADSECHLFAAFCNQLGVLSDVFPVVEFRNVLVLFSVRVIWAVQERDTGEHTPAFLNHRLR